MALKGVIQGAAGAAAQGGGSGVTSVGLVGPAPFITGPPVTSSGNLSFDFSGTPIPVSQGGTGMGSFAANSILQAGPTSTSPHTSIPLTNLLSNFLRGDGTFAVPPSGGSGGGAGTVTSVDIAVPPGFTVSGDPITVSGTMTIGVISPSSVSAGGTGAGSFTSNALIQAGLSSTGAFRSLPLNQLTSNFLDGTGTFRIPINPGGTVQSVALSLTSEFSVTGSPILGSGTLNIGFTQPLAVAHGGTGMGSFGPSVVLGGLSSAAPLQGLPFNNLTSNYLRGDGVFAARAGNTGTVTSVDLSLSSEFRTSGNPITGQGTLVVGFVQPLNVAHGGTGLGSFGPGVLLGGLTSTGAVQGLPLTNLTSNFLRGDGVFGVPPSGGGGGSGTVTSVALQMSSEFNVTGSPVTTAGTLMGSWVFQTANFFFGGPATAPSNTPAFRLLVNADIPQSMSGKTMTSSTFQNPTLATQVLQFGSSIKWNMNSGAIALLGMDSTAQGTMDTPANVANTGAAILRVMQLGTGLTNLSWNAFWKFEAVSGTRTTPTLSSGFGNIDVVSLYMESTAGYGVARKQFK